MNGTISARERTLLRERRDLIYYWTIPLRHYLGVSLDRSKCGGVFLISFGVTFGVLHPQHGALSLTATVSLT